MPIVANTDSPSLWCPWLPSSAIVFNTFKTSTTGIMNFPARNTKLFSLPQVRSRIPRKVGNRYGGSSIKKGDDSPLNKVFFISSPVMTAIAIPIKYSANTTFCPPTGKNTAANKAYTGNRAPQDMNGFIIMVSTRSRWFSIVRVDIIAGTLQPKPTSNGTKALPGKPITRIKRSMINAARAI